MSLLNDQLSHAITCLQQGGVIAYPTEAVFGLGCDPRNEVALRKILSIKKRSHEKGMILIAANFEQCLPWITPIPDALLARALATWPGPHTWLFPANPAVSELIRGTHPCVALRVSAHPIAKALCEGFDSAIISTSANLAGHPPAKDIATVKEYFGAVLDACVDAPLGGLKNPSEIRDLITGKLLRSQN